MLLKEANETKDKMFSIISHDLLGPFGNIRESLEMIVNKDVNVDEENMHSFIKAMWNSISSAYSLLENLLYWARNQQGRMVYKPRLISLNSIIHETYAVLDGVARHKSITLKTNLIEDFTIFADKNAVKTIIRNLVSNSIKFTDQGGTITTKVKNRKDNFVLVSVVDTGIGMDEQTCEKLFSKEKAEPRWGTKGEKGVGLGLVITKEFVDKHGGEIWVESKLGEGTTFYFTLPKSE
jgi:signal transduction histidine kinase